MNSFIYKAKLAAGPGLLVLSSLANGPAQAAPSPEQRIAKAAKGNAQVPGAIVLVRRAGHRDWSYVAGHRSFGGARLIESDEFRIASVTKTFVATALLRLVEQQKLALDDTIAAHLPPAIAAILSGGGYNPAKITIANLLTHRAGLRDYATTQAYFEAVGANPGRRWTPAEQIALTVTAGPPLSAPDTDYAYSDAGYVLIGEIIVQTTGQPLGTAVAELVGFKRLGLAHTYWEPVPNGIVTAIPKTRAHAYQDGIDTAVINPSFDMHGGGGLVSTVSDLMTFFQALLEGKVLESPASLALMEAPARRPVPPGEGNGYGLGIELVDVNGVQCWGHNGHWGSSAFWCPASKAGFVYTVNAAGDEAYRRAKAIFKSAADMATAALKTR